MNDFVKKLLDNLEPTIIDLDDFLKNLDINRGKLKDCSDFLDFVHDDIKMVGSYADQNLVLESLEKLGSTDAKYRANCYLLNGNSESVQLLPQYQEAVEYLETIIGYFKNEKECLLNKVSELENICEEKLLNRKYFEVFQSERPYVLDTEEFSNFIDKQSLEKEDKIALLKYTIKNNVEMYKKS